MKIRNIPITNLLRKNYMSKTVLTDEYIKKLTQRVLRLERFTAMNHKYISHLLAEIAQIKEEMKTNGIRSADSATDNRTTSS